LAVEKLGDKGGDCESRKRENRGIPRRLPAPAGDKRHRRMTDEIRPAEEPATWKASPDRCPAQVVAVPPNQRSSTPGFPFRPSPHSVKNRLARSLWNIASLLLFRSSPSILHGWRRGLLRLFGARIGRRVAVHPSVRVWAPWNLEMGPHSCLGPEVDCYCVNAVRIGAYATVSQYSFLCTASHDPDTPDMTLITAPIVIGDHAWIAADVFIAPGVTVREGAVVGARSTVLRDVPQWTIVAGNPVRRIRSRGRAVIGGTASNWLL
jgi:putative colanic acid biosynthesis acetyltransferase WcaF